MLKLELHSRVFTQPEGIEDTSYTASLHLAGGVEVLQPFAYSCRHCLLSLANPVGLLALKVQMEIIQHTRLLGRS